MARYIDADKFIKQFERALEHQQKYGLYNHAKLTEYVIKAIENEPTADVVAKSEVARLQEQVSDLQDERYSETETNKHLGAEYIALRKEKNALNIEVEALKIANEKMYAANKAQAREIFEEIEKILTTDGYLAFCSVRKYKELKKKYTEDQSNG